ncbi:GNAT family N-acetyltransferase [Streptomyces sp. NPDC050085]|uniref:GNAT family N-acetyltransferase n=1 Tax=Streptomyces sp. NPDC050085 TaxID=3365600 RepID=UPI00378B7F1F
MTVEVKHYTAEHLSEIRQLILDIHVEVRHHDFGLNNEFNSVERFGERLTRYASRPGFTAAVGWDGDTAAGFAFGITLGPESTWWRSMITPLPDGYTAEDGQRTVALNEIVVRKPWRGRGVAWQLHEEWLARRTEQRVTLLVNPAAGGGSVQAVYEAWGYRAIGKQQPFSDSPVYVSMTRELA